MAEAIPELKIPAYFFSGRHDLTVNRDISLDYFNKLDCPFKGFYTFENSAHSPMFEEPVRFLEVMTSDVLNNDFILADR